LVYQVIEAEKIVIVGILILKFKKLVKDRMERNSSYLKINSACFYTYGSLENYIFIGPTLKNHKG